jgi:single-stranded DNA-binding protein
MQENRCHLAGYLAAKPTVRFLGSGIAVADALLGQSYRYSHEDTPSEHTNWFSLVFYGELANLACELEEGTNLYVEGTFDQRPAASEHHAKRYDYEVIVHKFFQIGELSHEPLTPTAISRLRGADALRDESHEKEALAEQIAWPI